MLNCMHTHSVPCMQVPVRIRVHIMAIDQIDTVKQQFLLQSLD